MLLGRTLRQLDSVFIPSQMRYLLRLPHSPQDKQYIKLSDPNLDVRPITADKIFN
jgi:hypothetical protein